MCLEGCVSVPGQTGVRQAFQLSGMSERARCANCLRTLQLMLDTGCKAPTTDLGPERTRGRAFLCLRGETFPRPESTRLALQSGRSAKPLDLGLFLKLFLKSKE